MKLTAADVAYEDSQGEENSDAVILVYDFGGDKHLGGNTLTNIIAQGQQFRYWR